MKNIKQKPRLHASWIDPKAKEIVSLLQKAGFTTYLVGGCVRDLLAGVHPKDFDIATNAEPQQVRRKVWNSYIIGRRFRLVLAKRGDQQYEIATFRREASLSELGADENSSDLNALNTLDTQDVVSGAPPSTELNLLDDADKLNETSKSENRDQAPGIIKPPDKINKRENEKEFVGDNFFGTPEQDALRRDFTVNALFYDPIQDELIDYCNGMADIETRTLRMIGDPAARILEDPIRSLRAIRLAHKIKFKIEENLRLAIAQQASAITKSVLPRRREEFLKFLRLPEPSIAWIEMFDLGLIENCLPSLMPVFADASRQETFLYYLNNIQKISPNLNDPVDAFTVLTLAVLHALADHPEKDLLIQKLMRDELMVFKAEQAQIFARIEMANTLTEVDKFRRRGTRRQQAVIKNENFPSAFRIACFEKILSANDILYWSEVAPD